MANAQQQREHDEARERQRRQEQLRSDLNDQLDQPRDEAGRFVSTEQGGGELTARLLEHVDSHGRRRIRTVPELDPLTRAMLVATGRLPASDEGDEAA